MVAQTQKAKEFRSWISDILTSLRKNEILLLKKQLYDLQPKLDLYNQCINAENYMSVLQISKILKLKGRNKIFKFLRDEEILMSKGERYNLPYQQYIDQKLFTVVIKSILAGGKILNIPVTLVQLKD